MFQKHSSSFNLNLQSNVNFICLSAMNIFGTTVFCWLIIRPKIEVFSCYFFFQKVLIGSKDPFEGILFLFNTKLHLHFCCFHEVGVLILILHCSNKQLL